LGVQFEFLHGHPITQEFNLNRYAADTSVAPHARALLQSQKNRKKVIPMALPQDLLEMLVCPICKEHVQPLAEPSGLKCPVCRRIYPVRDDIPVMLPEEASVASE